MCVVDSDAAGIAIYTTTGRKLSVSGPSSGAAWVTTDETRGVCLHGGVASDAGVENDADLRGDGVPDGGEGRVEDAVGDLA